MTDAHEAYCSLPGIRWSHLKHMARSPQHYAEACRAKERDTEAMQLGRLTHSAVFEPDTVPLRYAVWPAEKDDELGIGGRRAGKVWESFRAVNERREIVTEAQYERALRIRDAVRGHPKCAPYLAEGRAEVPLSWTDEATGLLCKCKVDFLGAAAVDLKTGADISPRTFANRAAAMLYHGQFAYYTRGLRANGYDVPFKVIAAESDAPFDCGLLDVGEDELWAGDELVGELLGKVAACTESGVWPGQYPDEAPFKLPGWVYQQADAAYEREVTGLAPAGTGPMKGQWT